MSRVVICDGCEKPIPYPASAANTPPVWTLQAGKPIGDFHDIECLFRWAALHRKAEGSL